MQVVDHVVVGGGVMGSAAAWQLAARGRDVLLLERFEPGHVRGASHGASRIYRTTYDRPEYVDLALEALDLWRSLDDPSVLTLNGGVSHGVRHEGVAASFAARGVPHEWLTPAAAGERWPGLRFEGSVLHETSTAGRLHADRAVAALQGSARSHGADVRHEVQVHRVVADGSGVLLETSTGDVRARSVVVAVGAWTAGLVGPLLGVDLAPALVVTQEQPAHFAVLPGAPDEDAWPSFTHQPLGTYPWPSGTYGLATPGEGIKVGFHGVGPVTDPDRRSFTPEPGQLAELQRYAELWLPGVDPSAPAPISCTYTTTPDSDFVLDRRGPVVVAAGFSGHGFKFAPAIGRVLADLASEPVDAPARAADPAFALARLAGARPTGGGAAGARPAGARPAGAAVRPVASDRPPVSTVSTVSTVPQEIR
ncbi:N-methyltryptophan oxidase [Cellulomonas chitinilytica]|uniref:N-methyltryptophan oxidase n=1 Tax=Cellulomonas chitinilytica TaxID=398759 RepID=A0A919P364_9CELL|nr:N-methyltryptophan oxidase [Cellulomonas chitinilytica]